MPSADKLLAPLSEPVDSRREVVARDVHINGKPFAFAESMRAACADVFHDEYAICSPLGETLKWVPKLPKEGCLVLDIGANCGAFSVWAFYAYNPSMIHAYEPHPEAWDLYVENATKHGLPVSGFNAAVCGVTASRGKLWRGLNNLGESTMTRKARHRDDDAIEVDVVQPDTLPACHVIKIDTEGDELYILKGLDLSVAEIICVEFHSADDEKAIRHYLDLHFQLFSGYHRNPETGILRFRRKHEENPQP